MAASTDPTRLAPAAPPPQRPEPVLSPEAREIVAASAPAPADAISPEAAPGLTNWGAEAIRLLGAELGDLPRPPDAGRPAPASP